VSIYAPRTAGTNYLASTAPDVISLGGNPDQLVIHGLVYTPHATLKIWAMANSGAANAPMFGGGLVTGSLEVALNASSTTFTFATLPAGTPATARTAVVTSTAVGKHRRSFRHRPGDDHARYVLHDAADDLSWHKL
jgi:hypothetical protein